VSKKKNKKSLLPKRIGGVKVPKALRKGRAARFLTSPLGVALISEAVVAAGAFAVGKESEPGSKARRFADHPLASLALLKDDAKLKGEHSADQLKAAFAAASAAFADALRSGAEVIEPTAKKSLARGEPRAAH
jgi:hypothetical protein